MTSSIIVDAKFQELNMSFTFNEQYEDKIIVNAIADHTPYQLQLVKNINLDLEEFKNALLSKHFKLVERTPEILRLKISIAIFEFKNIEKITLSTLNQTITELKLTTTEHTNQLKEQISINQSFERLIKQIRIDLDLKTTQMGDLRQIKNEKQEQTMKIIKKTQTNWEQRMLEKEQKMLEYETNQKLLLERINKIEGQKLKGVEEENDMSKQNEKLFNKREGEMKKLEEVVTRKMEEMMKTKEQKLDQLYSEIHNNWQQIIGKFQQKAIKENQEVLKRVEQNNLERDAKQKALSQQQRQMRRVLSERLSKLEERMSEEVIGRRFCELEKKMKESVETMQVQVKEDRRKMEQQLKRIDKKLSDGINRVQSSLSKVPLEYINQLKSEWEEKRRQEENRKIEEEERRQEEEERVRKIQEQNKLQMQEQRLRQQLLLQQAQTQNAQYRFSSTHKNSEIKLQNNNTRATNSNGGYEGLALVEGVVLEKGSSIRLRIQSIRLGVVVGVGFGIRNVIAGNQYNIKNCNQIGHGCFLLDNNGWSLSHSEKEHNNVETDFSYIKGDEIIVQREGDELVWRNLRTKKEFKMKVKLTADEWSQMCFCVYLDESFSISAVSIMIQEV